MSDNTLLSEFCSVCNNTKFKYRCPGCSARTCSLPCYKRHQQWAQCNGKRDPTKYVKKSQLATPAGIDHDFNFLTSVERGVEKAERDLERKGLGDAESDPQRSVVRRLNDHQYANAGVNVIRAPSGLSRHKHNNTHFSGKKNIIWTVEWVHPDTSRSLSDSPGLEPIQQAYNKHIRSSTKRKVNPAEPASDTTSPQAKKRAHNVPSSQTESRPSPEGQHDSVLSRGPDSSVSQASNHGTKTSDPGSPPKAKVADDAHSGSGVHGTGAEPVPAQHHFFLLRPRTSSSRHVLIPLKSEAMINECLRGSTVLEFPTVYVFAGPFLELPEEFMLEEDYVKHEQEEQKEFDDMMNTVNTSTSQDLRGQTKAEEGEQNVDSAKILDVLKQDLGS